MFGIIISAKVLNINEKNFILKKINNPSVSLGTLGNVSHGKTTFIKNLNPIYSYQNKSEIDNKITIKLGYSNSKITKKKVLGFNNSLLKYEIHRDRSINDESVVFDFSIVDCPGHEILASTLLTGVSIIDGSLLFISQEEWFPQSQSIEHLVALKNKNLMHIVIVLSKIDLLKINFFFYRYLFIKSFIEEVIYFKCIFIPFTEKVKTKRHFIFNNIINCFGNISRVLQFPPFFTVIRTFALISKTKNNNLITRGIFGGSLIRGYLKKNQLIEIRPGTLKHKNTYPFLNKIIGIKDFNLDIPEILPRGLIAIETNISSSATNNDLLVGSVVGEIGTLPPVYRALKIRFNIIKKNIKYNIRQTKKLMKTNAIEIGELVLLNINSATTLGVVMNINFSSVSIYLNTPVCSFALAKVTVSKFIEQKWRIIIWGSLEGGLKITPF
ncbi:eukaryotic translation initiation factor gamma SU (nucleomorph) [Bigelowiella natans]|uniref:protein-synthesizing GTPase n=1 Tax=Bigelowiella natans TaxID=227086 RepID=Q3LVV5_BIGNA|nr:eukaryotic translation initiation factor gamma SU [Bigelowiella natans]ABA27410.1 eukaryotic translation initiation factor gamma SU [Bigelowiella natans]